MGSGRCMRARRREVRIRWRPSPEGGCKCCVVMMMIIDDGDDDDDDGDDDDD